MTKTKVVSYAVAVAILCLSVALFVSTVNFYATVSALEVISAAALVAFLWLGMLLYVDSLEREPVDCIIFCFSLGVCIPPIIASVVNEWVHENFGQSYSNYLSAPLVEEALKISLVLIVFRLLKKENFGIIDSLLYSSTVCLGLAFSENILYFRPDGFGQTLCVRGVTGILHPLYTSMFVIAWERVGGWKGFILGVFGAVVLHSAWNYAVHQHRPFIVDLIIWVVPSLSGVLAIMIADARREAGIVMNRLVEVPEDERVLLSKRYRRLWELMKLWVRLRYNESVALDKYYLASTSLAFARENQLDETKLLEKFESARKAVQGDKQ